MTRSGRQPAGASQPLQSTGESPSSPLRPKPGGPVTHAPVACVLRLRHSRRSCQPTTLQGRVVQAHGICRAPAESPRPGPLKLLWKTPCLGSGGSEEAANTDLWLNHQRKSQRSSLLGKAGHMPAVMALAALETLRQVGVCPHCADEATPVWPQVSLAAHSVPLWSPAVISAIS